MSSKTYVRASHHVQVKILHKMKILDHGLSLLLMQFLGKLHDDCLGVGEI